MISIPPILRKLACLIALVVLASGLTAARAQSTSVDGGVLSWTVTQSSGRCGPYGLSYTEWNFSSFKFNYGGTNYSVGAGAAYFNSPGTNEGCPPNGAQPSSEPISLPAGSQCSTITFFPGYGGSGSASCPAPTISISPSTVSSSVASGDLTIYGTNLSSSQGATQVYGSGPFSSLTPTYISPTQINVYYTLTCGSSGTETVTVQAPAGTASGAVAVTSAAQPPVINSGGISPYDANAGTSGYVSIYGENLSNCEGNTTSSIGAPGVTWSVTYQSPTQVNVYYSIPANYQAGTYPVTVTTTGGSSVVYFTIVN